MPLLLVHESADLALAISPDGRWWVKGEPVEHAGVSRYLYKCLTRNAAGAAIVRAGRFEAPVAISDAAFIVNDVDLSAIRTTGIALVLNDGSREMLRPDTLRITADDVPYCAVREGRFEARFSRAAYYRLAEHIRLEQGKYVLDAGGRDFVVLGP